MRSVRVLEWGSKAKVRPKHYTDRLKLASVTEYEAEMGIPRGTKTKDPSDTASLDQVKLGTYGDREGPCTSAHMFIPGPSCTPNSYLPISCQILQLPP